MNVRLNKKHQKTLEAIFSTQTSAKLQWRRIEALFMALGATKEEEADRRLILNLEEKLSHFTDHIPEKRQGGIKLDVQETFSQR